MADQHSSDSLSPRHRREQQLREGHRHLERQIGPPHGGQGLENLDQPMWLAGGGVLAWMGLRRLRTWTGLLMLGVGSGLVYRGLAANDLLGSKLKRRLLKTAASETTRVQTAITIDRPVQAVYATWRELSNLQRSMRHIESTRPLDGNRWQIVSRVPGTNLTIGWEADIVEDEPNERLIWRSTDASDLQTEGRVEFVSRRDNESTELHVDIVYHPPAGKVGRAVADFLQRLTRQTIKQDLRRFKQYVETGVVATIEGQSSGREQPDQPPVSGHTRRRLH